MDVLTYIQLSDIITVIPPVGVRFDLSQSFNKVLIFSLKLVLMIFCNSISNSMLNTLKVLLPHAKSVSPNNTCIYALCITTNPYNL
jgi:hypothetical protein